MGLDIALGVVILLAGLRGWWKGFLLQAIQLGAVIGGIFLAAPARDYARPHAQRVMTGVDGVLLDRILWWAAALGCYLVLVWVPSAFVKMHRKRTYAEFEPNRGDQSLGFTLGMLKGSVVVVFLAAALLKYVPDPKQASGWWGEQADGSMALAWSVKYAPAEKIWNCGPVQSVVSCVKKEGFGTLPEQIEGSSSGPAGQAAVAEATEAVESLRKGERPPRLPDRSAANDGQKVVKGFRALEIPRGSLLNPKSPSFLREVDEVMRGEGLEP